METSIPKWKCEHCTWQGNTPAYDDAEPLDNDEIYLPLCPCCGAVVSLNWDNPNNQLRFFKAMFEVR